MTKELKISDRLIARNHAPFIIAEMSGNHNQSLERALEIVEAAARSGAHGLKIQTYTPDTMTIDLTEREFRPIRRGPGINRSSTGRVSWALLRSVRHSTIRRWISSKA